jgi:hypothetical protein
MTASDQGAGHPRPDGQAEEERVVELRATTTPPAGMWEAREPDGHHSGVS